jgi:hypothetical protein
MKNRIPPTAAALALLAAMSPAQESRALFDAAVVQVDAENRLENLIEYDGTQGYEALSWWWEDGWRSDLNVRGWDVDPAAGFAPLWSLAIDSSAPNYSGGYVSVTAAAVDGPEQNDVIVTHFKSIRIYLNGAPGAPVHIQTIETTSSIQQALVLDVDQDGDDDLVTRDSNVIRLYENGGSANAWNYLAAPVTLTGTSGASRIRVAELTGDTLPDLFYVHGFEIIIQPLATDFTFPAKTVFALTTPLNTPMPTVGDIDGDEDVDAVIFSLDPTDSSGLYTVLRRESATTLARESIAVGGPATDLVDLDGDGDLDGACCGGGGVSCGYLGRNVYGSVFELSHNDGTGAFTPSFELAGLGADRLNAAVDIDFDGDVDLMAGRVVYYSPGPIDGPFATEITQGEHQSRLLRDWDGDGDQDLRPGYEEVRRSDGTGSFEPMTPAMQAPVVNGLTFKGPGYAGDYDGDGDDDLLVAKFKDGTFRRMRLLANTGGGQLEDMGDASDPAVSFSKTGEDYLDPRGGWAVDIDLDGDDDLITWEPQVGGSNGTLWINDGSGYFQASPLFSMSNKRPLGAAKFDSNNVLDLVVAKTGTTYENLYVQLLKGDGSLKQSIPLDAHIEGDLGAVAIGDFDNDGDTDLVVCDQTPSQVARTVMFQNDGAASFTAIDFGIECSYRYCDDGLVVKADVNDDGWSDLIVSSLAQSHNSAAILLRNPGGVMFQAPVVQTIRPYQARDVDGDGDQDLIDGQFDDEVLIDDRVVLNRLVEGASAGSRRQVGDGVAGAEGFHPTLGARTFGGYAEGDSIKFLLTGAAPGTTGRFIVTEVGTTAASTYTITPGTWGTRPTDLDVTKNFVRVFEFVTSGDPLDSPGTGKWDTRDVIAGHLAGRTLHYRVEIDDPGAPGGQSETNGLYVRFAD